MREPRVLVLLDRDGTINRRIPGGYVTQWAEFVFLPGVLTALAGLTDAGVALAVATNQAAVGKDLVTTAELDAIHRRMTRAIEEAGGQLAGVYVCPHLSEAGCACRKPRPGLLERAAQELGYAPNEIFMVGDSPTDVEAGRRAGCRTIRLAAEGADDPAGDAAPADHVVPDLAAAANVILAMRRAGLPPAAR